MICKLAHTDWVVWEMSHKTESEQGVCLLGFTIRGSDLWSGRLSVVSPEAQELRCGGSGLRQAAMPLLALLSMCVACNLTLSNMAAL